LFEVLLTCHIGTIPFTKDKDTKTQHVRVSLIHVDLNVADV